MKKILKSVLVIFLTFSMILGISPFSSRSDWFINASAVDTSLAGMTARAEALVNYTWIPSQNISTWNGNTYNGRTYFAKGETVKGVPYTLFTSEVVSWSLCSLSEYKSVASSNYSTTKYCASVGATRTGPVYGSCCADLVCEVFGGSFMNGSTMRYHNVSAVQNSPYATTSYNVKASNIVAGDALSDTGKNHIIWVGEVTDSYFVIYEQTPPVARKTTISKSSINSSGYLVYGGKIYSTVTKSNEFTGGVQRDTKIDVWASTKGDGYQYYDCPEITYGTTQNRYYIWFKVFDANTGDLYNSYSNTSYTSTVSIRYSDGTEFYSCAYSNSDSNWISVVPQKSDTYTINITLTGDIQGNYSQSFVVGYDADLIANKSSVTLDLQGTNSSTITFTPSGSYPGSKGMLIDYDDDYIQINSNGWNNGVYSLSFSGLKAGKTTITADLYEGYTGNENVVATATINVTINGPSYTLSYNANGGTGAPSAQTGGSEYAIPYEMPTRTGYTFAGWSTSSSASNGIFFPLDEITIPSDKTLYAVWKPATTIYTGTTTVSPAFRNQTVCYKFTPSVSGTYKFTGVISTGSNSVTGLDNHLYLYNSSGACLINTASSSTSEADFTYNLVAGNTYYFTTQRYSVVLVSEDYDVSIELVSASSYTLSYNANGGSGTPSTQTGATSYTISSTIPTRFGYTFLGWSKNSSATSATYEPGEDISLSSNTTLYAVWKSSIPMSTSTTYTNFINFADQELYYSFTPGSSGDYVFESSGSLDTKVYVYTSSGTEIGYDDDSSDEGNNFKLKVNLTSGTNYYVMVRAYGSNTGSTSFSVIKDAPTTYTLSYSANGGSGAPSSQTGAANYTVSSTVPTRFGYNFIGWSKSSSATSATYESGDTITLTADTTLYAVWSQPQISVNSSATANIASGGQVYYFKLSPSAGASYVIYSTGDSDTKAFLYDSDGNEVENDDDDGDGQNFRICRNLTGGSDYILAVKYYSSSTTGNIPVKFGYAYGVYYYSNGGSGAPDNQVKDYGKNLILSTTIPIRNGYTFLGWSTSSSATTATYSPGDVYSSDSTAYLYAVWEANPSSYTLSYNANGGSGAPSSQTGATNYTISSTVPTRFGYTFIGWSKSSSATSATYEPGDSVSISSNTTLYAVWKSAATISANTNISTTISFANQEVYYTFTPSSSGDYTFESSGSLDSKMYLYSSSGTELGYDDDSSENGNNFMLTESLTANSKYYIKIRAYDSYTGSTSFTITQETPATYTLTYNANGGSGAPSSNTGATSYTISSTIPTRFGHTFLGWSKSSSATSATYESGDSITLSSDTTLYAVWSSVSSISLDCSLSVPITTAGQEQLVKFIPDSSKTYTIESSGSDDTYVYLYDEDGNRISYNDDGGDNQNFSLSYDLVAGETYYYGIKFYDSTKTGTISVSLNADNSSISKGDVNDDGYEDATDASLIARYDAGYVTLTSNQLAVADVNEDGYVDATDASLIARYDAGYISEI